MLLSNEYVVAIDCGKANTKVVVIDSYGTIVRTDIFPTKVSDNLSQNDNLFVNAKTFKFDGKSVAIGSDNLETETTDKNSKNDEIHKMCTLYGIASNVKNNDIVDVVIGCPLSVFGKSQIERQNYRDNVIPKGRIDCDIIDHGKVTHKYFEIRHRAVLAESTGIIYMHKDLLKQDIAVIDIGGLNVNAFATNNGSIIPETCVSIKKGSRLLYDKLRTEYNTILEDEGVEFDDNRRIEKFARQGYVSNYEKETSAVTRQIIEGHINEIIKELGKDPRWGSLKKYDSVVFVGGTSILLNEYIHNTVSNAITFETDNEALFSNALGFAHQFYDRLS